MTRVRFAGAVPGAMAEGAVNGDWAATLALSGDLEALRAIELVGPGALFFAMQWDAALGVVFLSPGAAADYEGLTANGGDPTLAFSLRYTFADGTTETDATTVAVGVTGVDDTPPQALRFAAGGIVRADQLGGAIGLLEVDDPDTAGPFSFTVVGWDDWMFEFDGPTLRLRSGVNLGLDAIPVKPLIIAVSDGRQSAAFVLDIQVIEDDPGTLPILPAGTPFHGVTALGDGRAVSVRDADAFVALPAAADGAREIVQADAPTGLLTGAAELTLPQGRIVFDAESDAARADRLHRAIAGVAPDAAALAALVVQREAGAAWTAVASALLADAPAATDPAYLTALYQATVGRAPTPAELQRGVAVGRVQAAVDLALGAEAAAFSTLPADGLWVALPLGSDTTPEWLADRGGTGAAPVVPPPTELFFL